MMQFNVVASGVLLLALVCCETTGSSTWVKHGNLCYYFSSIQQSRPWTIAYQICQKKGAILARVESADVNNFIKLMIPSTFQAHWIGVFSLRKHGKQMVYSDDLKPITYSNYAAGHPKSSFTFLRGGSSTMVWHTGNSNHMYQYICQKEC